MMQINTFQGGFDKNLCYLVWCEETKYSAVIDPSVKPQELVEKIESKSLKLDKILITHTHKDHWQYLDDFLFYFPTTQVCMYKNPTNKVIDDYRKLSHNELISIGNNFLNVLHTPGHFKDSICFWDNKNKLVFTGDTMFIGRTGRTINMHSNIEDLYNSIYNILLTLPSETTIYPGHNYGFSITATIRQNIDHSSFFQCKSMSEFICVMENYEKSRKSN